MNNGGSRDSRLPSRFIEKELDRLDKVKAEKDAVGTKFESTDKELRDLWTKVRSNMDRMEEELKEQDGRHLMHIKEHSEKISGWDKWFKGIIVAVIAGVVAIVSTVAGLVHTNQTLSTDMEDVQSDVTTLSGEVQEVQDDVADLKKVVVASQETEEEKKERKKELKKLLKDAIHEAEQDIRPNNNRRRTGRAGRARRTTQ